MKAKVYDLMNWAAIEGIVYSEEDKPGEFLGAHVAGSSTLYQAFFPNAKKVSLVLEEKDKTVPMEVADEEGFYAALVTGKKNGAYHYEITTLDNKKVSVKDPYGFAYSIKEEDAEKYAAGIHYELPKVLGSHEMTVNKEKGVGFAVWMPGAIRVSVIGAFNDWDGRVYPMNRMDNTDIFTLFIPGLSAGTPYQYEVKVKDGNIRLMNDPYALREKLDDTLVSKVHPEDEFGWGDASWVKSRKKEDKFFIYAWDGSDVWEADKLAAKIKAQGFTHVSLPAFSLGDNFYQVPEFFETEKVAKEFVNEMHKAGLGVLFHWQTDSCHDLYQKEVSNFYITNILYWMEGCHFDGLILSGLEALLYLDYGKEAGQWCPNIYGGSENLEGVEFVKHTNSILSKRNQELLLMADLDAIWPNVTEALENDGLGFDYRYDTEFTKEFISYLMTDPYFRSNVHEKIINRMNYAYREKFVMAFDAASVQNLWNEIPGETADKFNTMKVAFAYLSFLPGRLLSGLQVPENREKVFAAMEKKCCSMKGSETALSWGDDRYESFQWINCFGRNENTVSFLRKEESGYDFLLVVAHFANDEKEEFNVGVPYEGKYELIFSTDEKAYGGSGKLSKEPIYTEDKPWDGLGQLVNVALKPLSVNVYRYLPYTEEELYDFAHKKAEAIRMELEEEARKKAEEIKARAAKAVTNKA